MSAETPWKDNTENLRKVPRICVECYAYAWPGNSAAPRITPRTQVYAWNITPMRGQASSSAQNSILGVEHNAYARPSFLQHPESKFRRGSKPSSSQALQSPRICVEGHAYAWRFTSSAQNLISPTHNPTHMRGVVRICVRSRVKKGQK
ncbi:hypothetical protein PIB30_071780, partial [Stylosanthes scabra]|nr:hypothetical protein [Stylosanthes scabra]